MSDIASIGAGSSVCSPAIIRDGSGSVWAIMSLWGDPPNYANGSITAVYVADPSQRLTIMSGRSVCGTVDAVTDANGTVWAAFTERMGGETRVLLGGFAGDRVLDLMDVSDGFGKHESPRIVVGSDCLWVVWNTYSGSLSQVHARQIRLGGDDFGTSGIIAISNDDGRHYRPCPVIDADGRLYVFYEAFFGRRYHLMARVFDESADEFTPPIEVGLDHGNDQAASVCILDGYPVVVWENSEPLYKGYVYPPMPDITIPAFGHGWRINTVIAARRIRYNGGRWLSESFAESGTDAPIIHIGEPGFNGASSITATPNGGVVLSYVSFTLGQGMKIRVKALDGDKWIDIPSSELTVPQRIPAGILCDDNGKLYISHLHRNGDEPEAIVYSSMPPIISEPKFSEPKVMRHVSADDIYVADPRRAIDYRGGRLKVYWGDLHMHSNVSPCSLHTGFHCTELEEKYRFAKDVGDLDFAMVTDHDMMSDFDWARTKREAAFNDMPGGFVAFPGVEWTSSMLTDRQNFGHRNILFMDENPPILRVRDAKSDTPDKLWSHLDPSRSMTIPHHPSCAEHPFDWDYFNQDFDRLAEIFQVRGVDEYDDCPMYPPNFGRGAIRGHTVNDALRRGYRIGFTSGGEHEGVGVTAVLAAELSREALFAALRARHTYGTTGVRLLMDFRVNGHIMGDEIPAVRNPKIHIHIDAPCDIRNMRLMRDGKPIAEWTDLHSNVEIDWSDESLKGNALAANHYYYAAITLSDGEMAWSSPVFLMKSD